MKRARPRHATIPRHALVGVITGVLALTGACSTSGGTAIDSGTAPSVVDGGGTGSGGGPGSTSTSAPLLPLPSVAIEIGEPSGGFAEQQGLTGGHGRAEVVVESDADSGPGTYRDALSGGDRYIRFDPDLDGAVIQLDSPVEAHGSDLTLDGAGIDVTISGSATRFTGTNIVVAGLAYSKMTRDDNSDALTFRGTSGTQVFGIYGSTFSSATDGLIDLIWNDGFDVFATICGNRLERHDKAVLVDSGSDGREGGLYHVTMCRNHWYDTYQRTPLSRNAQVHQYNSVFERYGKPSGEGGGSKAGGTGDASQHLLESNIAIPRATGEVTWDGSIVETPRSEWAGPQAGGGGYLRIEGTLLGTTGSTQAIEVSREPERVFEPTYSYPLVPASTALRDVIAATAGTCVPSGDQHVNPCAELLIATTCAPLLATVDGAHDRVEFTLDGQRLDDTIRVSDQKWSAPVPGDVGRTGVLEVTAFADGGRSVTSDPVVLGVIPCAG